MPDAIIAATTPAAAATAAVAPVATATAPAAPAVPATPATPAAPVSYDLKPSTPDALPAPVVAQVAEIAKDLGLSQENAQKLLARHEAGYAAHQAAQVEARQKQSDAWYDAIAADKDLGGANLAKTTDNARRGMAALSADEQAQIAASGYQNNPILVKLLALHGATLGEGTLGGKPGATKANDLRGMYPSMPNP